MTSKKQDEKDGVKRLTKAEQNEIRTREQLLKNKDIELRIVRNEYQAYIERLLKAKGLDAKKEYSIGVDGELVEVKK